MVLKSYAKINLSLSINRKLSNGLHEIQSIYCLVDLYDSITIKKNNKEFIDDISFTGTHSKHISKLNNSVSKSLNLLRKKGLIDDYYSVRINKKIIIDVKPKIPMLPSDTAQGNKKAISKSNIIKSIATK